MAHRVLPLLILLLAIAPVATADSTVTDAHDAVRAAHKAGNTGELARLALRGDPDPWLVAGRLIASGELGAASAFAHAATHPELDGLHEYITSRRALGSEDVIAAALATFEAAKRLRTAGRPAEAAAKFEASAKAAAAIRWRAHASQAYYECGEAHFARADFAAALGAYKERLALETALQSAKGRGRAEFAIAGTLRRTATLQAALPHLERAEALARESDDTEYVARVLSRRAAIAGAARQMAEVERLAVAGLAVLAQPIVPAKRARFRTDIARIHLVRAELWQRRASAAAATGRLADSLQHLDQVIAAGEAAGSQRTIAQAAITQGALHEYQRHFDEALLRFEQAADLFATIGDPSAEADAVRRRAQVLERIGDLPGALRANERARGALEQIGDKVPLGRAQLQRGRLANRLNEWSTADAALQRAAALARDAGDDRLEAEALRLRAHSAAGQGDYPGAMAHLREAMRVAGRAGPDTPLPLHRFDEGSFLWAVGRTDDARSAYERARADAVRTKDQDMVLRVNERMAVQLTSEREFSAANTLLSEVIAARKARNERGTLAASLSLRAQLRYWWTDMAGAGLDLLAAQDIYRELGDQPSLGRTYVALAQLELAEGRVAGALALLEKAEPLINESSAPSVRVQLHSALAGAQLEDKQPKAALGNAALAAAALETIGLHGAEGEGTAMRQPFSRVYERGVAAAWNLNQLDRVFEFAERGRDGQLLAALGGRDRLRAVSMPPEWAEQERAQRFAEASALARLSEARRRGKRREISMRRKAYEAARAAYQRVIADIQRDQRVRTGLTFPRAAALKDVQSALDARSAFVSFIPANDAYVALVVTSAGIRAVELGTRADVEAACRAVLLDAAPHVDEVGLLAARTALVDPLQLPKTVERIYVSAIGVAAFLPMAALDPSREIVRVFSATAWLELRQLRGSGSHQVLGLGDPDYSYQPEGRPAAAPPIERSRGGSFAALPATRDEVNAVADVKLLGRAASEGGLQAALEKTPAWRAIHLACHGAVSSEHPDRSALALSADASHDGMLTTMEVFRLRMDADLVVLSGCGTSLGKIVGGEGINGLPRAFLFAGTPRVIASLWDVDDEATRELMTKFYSLWNPKVEGQKPLSAAAALKAAQGHVRGIEKWKHPRYWAAWVLWGRGD